MKLLNQLSSTSVSEMEKHLTGWIEDWFCPSSDQSAPILSAISRSRSRILSIFRAISVIPVSMYVRTVDAVRSLWPVAIHGYTRLHGR